MRFTQACSAVLVTLVLPVGGALAAQAQFDGHRLSSRTDTLIEYLVKGTDTVRTGYTIDQLIVTDSQVIRRYDGHSSVLGALVDSIVDRTSDLRPIFYRDESQQMVGVVHFSPDSAIGWTRNHAGDSVAVRESLPGVVYNGSSFVLVVRASDLAEGREVSVRVFSLESTAVHTVGGRVAGSERVAGRECWVFKGHFGAMAVTFWVDKGSRRLMQQYLQPSVNLGILLTMVRLRPKGMPES